MFVVIFSTLCQSHKFWRPLRPIYCTVASITTRVLIVRSALRYVVVVSVMLLKQSVNVSSDFENRRHKFPLRRQSLGIGGAVCTLLAFKLMTILPRCDAVLLWILCVPLIR